MPVVYLTSLLFLAAVGFLFLRRVLLPQVRYISLVNDYFPLFLLLGIAISGIWMRHLGKVDIKGIKDLGTGLLSLSPSVPSTFDLRTSSTMRSAIASAPARASPGSSSTNSSPP